jgi:hypothetical protein
VEREIVVRRPGADWSFTLPDQHTIDVDQDARLVSLGAPMQGSVFELAGVEQTDEESIVLLGAELGRHGPPGTGPKVPKVAGYPLPEIQDELDRLRARWDRAGLSPQEFGAYAPGSSHEDQLRRIRRQLRESTRQ